MLKVHELRKEFQSGDHTVKAVDSVSFEIPTGTFASIIGKSGSGKSTLLALLGALDRPSSGLIEVEGEKITNIPDRRLIAYRRERIGFVFQQYNLVPNLTAIENVMLPLEFAGVKTADRITRAQELLSAVGLEEDKQLRRPPRLSGGEQQRVSIARALANRPRLILADEPTGNLDGATGAVIVKLLKQLAKSENTTVIVVTHDQSLAAQADMTFHLQDGKLITSHSKITSRSV